MVTVVETTGLDKGSVGEDGARGAPRVGDEHERPESIEDDIVEDRMSSAIVLEGSVKRVKPAPAASK